MERRNSVAAVIVALVILVLCHGLQAKNLLLWVISSCTKAIDVSVINSRDGREIGFPMIVKPMQSQYYLVKTFTHALEEEDTHRVCLTLPNGSLLVDVMAGRKVHDESMASDENVITAFHVSTEDVTHAFSAGSLSLTSLKSWHVVCTFEMRETSSSPSTKLCEFTDTEWRPIPYNEAAEVSVVNEMDTNNFHESLLAYKYYLMQCYDYPWTIFLNVTETQYLRVRMKDVNQLLAPLHLHNTRHSSSMTVRMADNFLSDDQQFMGVVDAGDKCVLGTTRPTPLSYFFQHYEQDEMHVRKVHFVLNQLGIQVKIQGNPRILIQILSPSGVVTWNPKNYALKILCVWRFSQFASGKYKICN